MSDTHQAHQNCAFAEKFRNKVWLRFLLLALAVVSHLVAWFEQILYSDEHKSEMMKHSGSAAFFRRGDRWLKGKPCVRNQFVTGTNLSLIWQQLCVFSQKKGFSSLYFETFLQKNNSDVPDVYRSFLQPCCWKTWTFIRKSGDDVPSLLQVTPQWYHCFVQNRKWES